MLHVKRRTQMDRMKDAVRDAVAYVDEIAGDERLRADVRAAIAHGAEARKQIGSDVAAGTIATRLAHDRKLRRKVRAMLDDLDSASDRMRRRKTHRLRNWLLVLGSVGAALAVIPNVRHWIAERMSDESDALSASV
jgi:hypothetical protein